MRHGGGVRPAASAAAMTAARSAAMAAALRARSPAIYRARAFARIYLRAGIITAGVPARVRRGRPGGGALPVAVFQPGNRIRLNGLVV